MSNKQNDIYYEALAEEGYIADLPYETLKDDQADIEARTCKIFECDKEAAEGWPCCSVQHGIYFRDMKEILKDACDADNFIISTAEQKFLPLKEEYKPRELTWEKAIYYGQYI